MTVVLLDLKLCFLLFNYSDFILLYWIGADDLGQKWWFYVVFIWHFYLFLFNSRSLSSSLSFYNNHYLFLDSVKLSTGMDFGVLSEAGNDSQD